MFSTSPFPSTSLSTVWNSSDQGATLNIHDVSLGDNGVLELCTRDAHRRHQAAPATLISVSHDSQNTVSRRQEGEREVRVALEYPHCHRNCKSEIQGKIPYVEKPISIDSFRAKKQGRAQQEKSRASYVDTASPHSYPSTTSYIP
jgi:hypothetical protein